jgi:hypothetical protein
MTVYISVISHGHAELIESLSCLSSLCQNYIIVIKSNKLGDHFNSLFHSNNFHWINEHYYLGFGNNNNIVFSYCESELGMKPDDIFIVLNPDVVISTESIDRLIEKMKIDNTKLAAINLFKDTEYSVYDNSIRTFPSLLQFIKGFLGYGNSSIINKGHVKESCNVDWAAGSFLAFIASHYSRLNGFDEGYFMYCEDIDICFRSNKLNSPVTYYPSISAQHLANHENRNIISKHFYWHVCSVFRFMLTSKGYTRAKSSLYHNK